jgi:hypothetical protein
MATELGTLGRGVGKDTRVLDGVEGVPEPTEGERGLDGLGVVKGDAAGRLGGVVDGGGNKGVRERLALLDDSRRSLALIPM